MPLIDHTPHRSPLGAFMRSTLGVRGSISGTTYHYAIGIGDGRARVFTGEMVTVEPGVRRATPSTFLGDTFIDVDSDLYDLREHEVVIARRQTGEDWQWFRPVDHFSTPLPIWTMASELDTAVTLHGYHALTHDGSFLTLDPQPWSWPGFQSMVNDLGGLPLMWGQRSGDAVYIARSNDNGSTPARLFRASGEARTPSRLFALPKNHELEDDAVVVEEGQPAQPPDYEPTGCGGIEIVDGWATGDRALKQDFGVSGGSHYLISAECVDHHVDDAAPIYIATPPVLSIPIPYRLKVQRADSVLVQEDNDGPFLPEYREQGKAFSSTGASVNPYVGDASYSRLGWLAGLGDSADTAIRLDKHQEITDAFSANFPLVFRDWFDTAIFLDHTSLDGSGITEPQARTVTSTPKLDGFLNPQPYTRWLIEYDATVYPFHRIQVRVEARDLFSA